MHYKIYFLDDGVQKSLPNEFREKEYKYAEQMVKYLNNQRKDKHDPYYWVQCVHEVLRGD